MNKTAIKNFSVWARRKLISDITYKAGLIGVSERGILQPLSSSTKDLQFFDVGTGKPTEIFGDEIKQRDALAKRIKEKEITSDYKTAFQFVIEEVAYTWFNRLIAIRFMEVNDYLPSRIRVLSSETLGKSEPDMVTKPFETDMDYSAYEKDKIMQLKDENKLNELFRMLFINQCNKLNEVLPGLFEKTADYTELLLNISFTDADGIVNHLIKDIEESDFTETVEIIGWMYQYYNDEPKDETFALLKKNVKITKERIPAVTQLFTPDWIVRYMVENSLGRLWMEGHPNETLKSEWRYYLEETVQADNTQKELNKLRDECKKIELEDIKIIDPCMGSGHILVYAFEVLMQIYESQGYTQRDASCAIVEHNLFGLDIDDRAYQLAYFAVMMKARKYDRRFLMKKICPNIYSVKESNNISKGHLKYFGTSLNSIERNLAVQQIDYLVKTLENAKEYGSILKIENCNWDILNSFVDDLNNEGQISFENAGVEESQEKLKYIIMLGKTMAKKYDVVCTNPPYMGNRNMSDNLSKYITKNYKDSKNDLYSVFIERCMEYAIENGYAALITMHSWMFTKRFVNLREKIINNYSICSLVHLGARAFEEITGEVVQTVAYVMRNVSINAYKGAYIGLTKFNDPELKNKEFFNKENIYYANTNKFESIEEKPMVYWISDKFKTIFEESQKLGDLCKIKMGLQTSNNEKFLRLWYEVDVHKIGFGFTNRMDAEESNKKWFPHCKSSGYRKWYGNDEYIVNWQYDGKEIREFCDYQNTQKKSQMGIANTHCYFKEGITWPLIGTNKFSIRYFSQGMIFNVSAPAIFDDFDNIIYYLGLLNTKIIHTVLELLNPTLNFSSGVISNIPVLKIEDASIKENIKVKVNENINICKKEWNSYETSWDFITHPLIKINMLKQELNDGKIIFSIEEAFNYWCDYSEKQFNILKSNEEELNQILIDAYDLQAELTPEVEEKDVTVRKADLQRDIKSFISYAVGCMLGRYSLDAEGAVYAGGVWEDCKYKTFIPDKDNCIPITDEEYFEDDIVGLFVDFVKKIFGGETLEVNLEFVASALGNKGNTSREIIRNYFVKDFYKDHVKTYQNSPIYWLYDSGKNDGFKALVYMHRYNSDTTGIVRVDYLHKMQKIYMSEIDRMQEMFDNSSDSREVALAEKRKEKLIKQLKETKEYDEKIAHLALSRIVIDLDDGVKVNYEKVQTGQDGKKLDILGKI